MAEGANGILEKSSSAACAAGPLMRTVLGISRRARAQSRRDGARVRNRKQLVAQSSRLASKAPTINQSMNPATLASLGETRLHRRPFPG